MAYLTPEATPDNTACRALFIPDDEQYLAIVRGALQELTFPASWTPYGTLTPDQAAANFVDMFDRFCFNEGPCRMIGEIIAYAGSTSPRANWLPCDGSSLERAVYSELFATIGTIYGSVDADHFTLPDLRGRSISGMGTGSGLEPVDIGQAYGEQAHTLDVLEMPTHLHGIPGTVPALAVSPGELPVLSPSIFSGDTDNAGGGNPHNNVGPRLGVNYLIVASDG